LEAFVIIKNMSYIFLPITFGNPARKEHCTL